MAKAPVKTEATDETQIAAEPVAQEAAAPAAEPAPAASVESEPRISVEEFCTRENDKDPKAYAGLYGFQRAEELAGRSLDTLGNFEKRLKAFMNRPTV